MSDKIITFKGTDKDMKCHGGFQYELGKEYSASGDVKACKNGFHACEIPMDVFRHFPPAGSRYFRAEQSGDLSRDSDDSKVASRGIKLTAEIGIPGLVKAQVEYVKAHTTTEHTDPKMATAGYRGAATAGSYGAATAGNRGAATAGYRGAATAGYSGAATSRGSVCVGENGCGLVRGNCVKVKGGMGAILLICIENDSDYDIKEWKAVVVDGETIKEDTWYTLVNGNIVEVESE